MTVQPFTPTGVTAKTTELYALSNSLLAAQADSVESDFGTWMKTNFSLTTAQSTYLTGMDNHCLQYYGSQCSMAFRSRLPISLDPGTAVPGYAKWSYSESTLKVYTNGSGALETSGTLSFKMEYRP